VDCYSLFEETLTTWWNFKLACYTCIWNFCNGITNHMGGTFPRLYNHHLGFVGTGVCTRLQMYKSHESQ